MKVLGDLIPLPFATMNKSYEDKQIEELEKQLKVKQDKFDYYSEQLPLQKQNNVDNSDLGITNKRDIQTWENEQQTLKKEIAEIQRTLASIRGESSQGGKSRRKKKRTKKSKKSKKSKIKRSRKARK